MKFPWLCTVAAAVAVAFRPTLTSAVRSRYDTRLDLAANSQGRAARARSWAKVTSDPFGDVPYHMVRDAARDGVTYSTAPATSLDGRLPSSILNLTGRQAKKEWDDAALKSALTSMECKGTDLARSCSFKNLYFNQDEHGFFVFSLSDTEHPDFNSVRLLHKWSSKGTIKRKDFATLAEFRTFMQGNEPQVHEGLSLVYDSVWHFNIGHALWDGLYPAFVALCTWGRQGEQFRSVVGIEHDCKAANTEDGKCMSEGVFKKFGGGEFLPYSQLHGTGWHNFLDSIAGSGRKGQRSINPEYELPGGRDLDAAKLFRDRMYSSHSLAVPQARASSLAERSSAHRGGIISNKRFNAQEVALLKSVASEMSYSTPKSGLQMQWVDYGGEDLAGNFAKQLELIGKLTFHISAPGTGQAYEPFLADGSVHVNLGDRRSAMLGGRKDEHFSSFMEEVWSEGVPHLRALHYDPYRKQPAEYKRSELTSLIQSAVGLVKSDFAIPVSPGDNLSPVAQVFKDYCAASAEGCHDLISLMNGDKSAGFSGVKDEWWCNANAWAENVVFENGGWSEDGQKEEGKTVHCLLDRPLLRKVRAERFGF